ncbi:Ribonuclease H domain [Dillenia turbinata]|uniref:Ribonuclease H domain n=1 Tax=Dillenia turbinata TaxID=194707 RepID=A0AAN8UP80_9MAGN
MGIKDSNAAELLALVKAVELSTPNEEFAGANSIFESDSMVVVNWTCNPFVCRFKYQNWFAKAARIASSLGAASLVHVPHKTHQLVDNFAKQDDMPQGIRMKFLDEVVTGDRWPLVNICFCCDASEPPCGHDNYCCHWAKAQKAKGAKQKHHMGHVNPME